MNTAIVADAQNLGFSIAIDVARPIIEDLKAGEGQVTPDQAFLGVSSTDVAELTDDVRANFDVEVDEGAFVTEVVPGSAADEAGLEAGDVIIAIDGDEVTESSRGAGRASSTRSPATPSSSRSSATARSRPSRPRSAERGDRS